MNDAFREWVTATNAVQAWEEARSQLESFAPTPRWIIELADGSAIHMDGFNRHLDPAAMVKYPNAEAQYSATPSSRNRCEIASQPDGKRALGQFTAVDPARSGSATWLLMLEDKEVDEDLEIFVTANSPVHAVETARALHPERRLVPWTIIRLAPGSRVFLEPPDVHHDPPRVIGWRSCRC